MRTKSKILPNIRVRLARPKDQDRVMELLSDLLSEEQKKAILSHFDSMESGQFHNSVHVLVLEDISSIDNVTFYMIEGTIAFDQTPEIYALSTVKSQQSEQVKNYGKILVSAVAKYAEQTKKGDIRVTSRRIGFWGNLGFRIVGKEDTILGSSAKKMYCNTIGQLSAFFDANKDYIHNDYKDILDKIKFEPFEAPTEPSLAIVKLYKQYREMDRLMAKKAKLESEKKAQTQVRLARAKDQIKVRELFTSLLSLDQETDIDSSFYSMKRGYFFNSIHVLVLANMHNEIIGAIAFDQAPEIYALRIIKSEEGKKYGKFLASAVAKYAEQTKKECIKLTSTQPSVGFWEKLGFKIVRRADVMRDSSIAMECNEIAQLSHFFDANAACVHNDYIDILNQIQFEPFIERIYQPSKATVKIYQRYLEEDRLEAEEINPYSPRVLIAHNLDGVEAGKIAKSNRKGLDNKNSALYGASVFANYTSGENTGTAKNTDDKIVIGYTSEGLPFLIVADGFYGCNTKGVFQFIDKYIILLMDEYANQLSKSEIPSETIKALITNIYSLYGYYSLPSVEFSMSIAITYEQNNTLYCAGFGIGDTGLVLRNSKGGIQQLAYSTSVNQFKDAFDQHSIMRVGIPRVINRNNIFNVPVHAGEEVLGYTYVLPELFLEGTENEEKYEAANGELITDKIVKRPISLSMLDKSGSLFNDVIKANNNAFESRCISAKNDKTTCHFGDDSMMGFVIIPTANQRVEMKHKVSSPLANEDSSYPSFFENKNKFDLFDETKIIEKDYYSKNSLRLYLKTKDNPVADYFNLREKLKDYEQPNLGETDKKKILDKCIEIFEKLKNEDNYPKDIKTKILHQYALGLIKQEPSVLYHLLDNDAKKKLSSGNQESAYFAKKYFKNAFDLGYSHAATRLGNTCYELQEFKEAKNYLYLAMDNGDDYAKKLDELYQIDKRYQEAKVEKPENNEDSNKCTIM